MTGPHTPGVHTDEAECVLARILGPRPDPFALLRREANPDVIEVLLGGIEEFDCLADLSDARHGQSPTDALPALVLLPYRQVGVERGYACHDDDSRALVLRASQRLAVDPAWLIARLPDDRVELYDASFDSTDVAYAATVRDVVAEEIGRGEGANFVIKRSYSARLADSPVHAALTALRRLLADETGAYWTFVVHTGSRTLVGASPERHVTLRSGTATMNPVSGTYRYPPEGPDVPGALEFLADQKEADELFMVVDEELKMMARICASGIRAEGPYLKQMNRLAHTEFLLSGQSRLEPLEILRETLFAPTVTGSPLENACSVIRKYEKTGRGYYSGVAALVGADASRAHTLDSAILIRTADISASGVLDIGVGATLVRHSVPEAEAAETHVKCAALLAAFTGDAQNRSPHARSEPLPAAHISDDARIRSALMARHEILAPFWTRGTGNNPADPCMNEQAHRSSVLLIDNEDTFTAMLGHYLCVMGLAVSVETFGQVTDVNGYDMVVVGPGPGDPRALDDPKISAIGKITEELLCSAVPFISLCLGHQVLCRQLGLPLRRKKHPSQGLRRRIDLFGRPVNVGYYNTFTAWSPTDSFASPKYADMVRVSRDRHTGEVDALAGPGFRSFQFHPESVISTDGGAVLADAVDALLSKPGTLLRPSAHTPAWEAS